MAALEGGGGGAAAPTPFPLGFAGAPSPPTPPSPSLPSVVGRSRNFLHLSLSSLLPISLSFSHFPAPSPPSPPSPPTQIKPESLVCGPSIKGVTHRQSPNSRRIDTSVNLIGHITGRGER